METVIYNTIKYLVELVKLFILVCLIFRIGIKRTKSVALIFGMSVALTAIISAFFDISQFGFSYGIILIITMFFALNDKKKTGLVIFSYVLICILDLIFCIVIMYACDISFEQIEASLVLNILLSSASIIVLSVTAVLNKIFGKNKKYEHISLKYIGLMILGSLVVAFYMTFVIMTVTNSKSTEETVTFLVFSLSGIIFVIVCILLMYNKSRNEQLKYETEMMYRLVKSQENYYTMLLQKDDETKQFRHDIRNHLYCMQTLFENGEYEQLKKYFEKMNEELKELSVGINTGNNLVNVILNEIKSRHSDVDLKWTGQIGAEIKTEQMDLCMIFSNLLSNAFEAAEKCESKQVNVDIKMLNSNLYVKVSNTALASPKIVGGNFISTKQGDGHGYGVKNIKKCVEKYQGSFESNYDNGVFCVEVLIPNLI